MINVHCVDAPAANCVFTPSQHSAPSGSYDSGSAAAGVRRRGSRWVVSQSGHLSEVHCNARGAPHYGVASDQEMLGVGFAAAALLTAAPSTAAEEKGGNNRAIRFSGGIKDAQAKRAAREAEMKEKLAALRAGQQS